MEKKELMSKLRNVKEELNSILDDDALEIDAWQNLESAYTLILRALRQIALNNEVK